MLRNIQLFCLLGLLLPCALSCSQKAGNKKEIAALREVRESLSEKNKYEFEPAALLIFLDDTESTTHSSAISLNLLSALVDQTGPIIATNSLLYNIFNNAHHLNEKLNELTKVFHSQFNPNSWVIKEINEKLSLLIPNWFLSRHRISLTQAQEFSANDAPTTQELKLGLKINHMKTKNDQLFENFAGQFPSSYFIDAVYNNSIFCARSDYQNKKIKIPFWAFFINGHGAFENAIAALSVQDFQRFLDFLQTKLNTRLLIISSCYASGVTLNKALHDIDSHVKKNYSYAIMTQAIGDRPTYNFAYLSVFEGKEVVDHENILKRLILNLDRRSNYTIDYQLICRLITQPQDKLQIRVELPQLKLPGLDWFVACNANKEVVSIGSTLAQSRGIDKPLNITNFFKTDPRAILLYTNSIPFELIINSDKLLEIISMAPVKKTKIYKISSKSEIDRIIEWFMPVYVSTNYLVPEIFFIKNINDEFADLLIVNNKENRYAYYKNIKTGERFFQENLEYKELSSYDEYDELVKLCEENFNE